MGAGVIPFAVRDGEVRFLLQTTFSGRKVGHYIDFGGGLGPGESPRDTAVREFVEETETLYFSTDLKQARRSPERVEAQIPVVDALFEQTLSDHPQWARERLSINPLKPKQWISYFVRFPYRDLAPLNREWELDREQRFKKRRELFWLSADELLRLYVEDPQKLWKRVRQLDDAPGTIEEIKHLFTENGRSI